MEKGDEPYYPVNDEKNNEKYRKYSELAGQFPNVIFGGRLGMYKYYDMHQVIAAALSVVKKNFMNEIFHRKWLGTVIPSHFFLKDTILEFYSVLVFLWR